MNDGILEASGVVKRFGPTDALRGVDLCVEGVIFVLANDNPVTVPWLDVILVPTLVVAAWLIVTAIGVTALGRAAPPVPLRTG